MVKLCGRLCLEQTDALPSPPRSQPKAFFVGTVSTFRSNRIHPRRVLLTAKMALGNHPTFKFRAVRTVPPSTWVLLLPPWVLLCLCMVLPHPSRAVGLNVPRRRSIMS